MVYTKHLFSIGHAILVGPISQIDEAVMDVAAFIQAIQHHPLFDEQIVHVQEIPERPGRFAEPDRSLPKTLTRLLGGQGIERLYRHQVAALEAARDGQDLVVVTGTASGRT